jgi:hypothetical protein
MSARSKKNFEALIWIISLVKSNCAECGVPIKRGDRILWCPDRKREESNLCRKDGEQISAYPGPGYWKVREEKLQETAL